MSTNKSLSRVVGAALLVLVCCVAVTRSRSFHLSNNLNKTVCPIQVEFDEDQNRIPRRIKMIKCANKPSYWCVHQHEMPQACCQHSHHGHVMRCEEMMDTVLVYYKDSGNMKLLEVSVGCSCVVERSTSASEIPSSPA